MSEENEVDTSSSCCASCGVAAVDEIKLKECDGCDLVRYCSDDCKGNHKSEHEEACKKRAAEIHDDLLFKQPESSLGDCPICMIPLPISRSKSTMMSCCSKVVCNGCRHAHQLRQFKAKLIPSCAFCRQHTPKNDDEWEKQLMKRVEMNDPAAILHKGVMIDKEGDHRGALDYYTKALELGHVEVHYHLARLYHEGHGVEKDIEKFVHHTEEAAIGGHPKARFNLACYEYTNGNIEKAVKHWLIAVKQGFDDAIIWVYSAFYRGFVSKQDLDSALCAHRVAVDASKSLQREAAEEYYRT